MKKPIFAGAGVAIVTPFKDGTLKINFQLFEELINEQIESGTDAIVVCGTTGEKSTLVYDEHIESIKVAVNVAKGRVPVIAGIGSNDTMHVVILSNDVEKCGVDGLLTVTPYYNKASQDGLIESYSYIEERVSTPIILYNVPSRTGVNISLDTYKVLCKHKNIVATKEASGNISAIAQIIEACGDELDVYSGNDDQIVPIMSLGGKGVISVLSNVVPLETHNITEYCLNNDFAKARELANKYLTLANDLFLDVNPIPAKEAMNMMGLEVGPCRLPLVPMAENTSKKLLETLKKYNLA